MIRVVDTSKYNYNLLVIYYQVKVIEGHEVKY